MKNRIAKSIILVSVTILVTFLGCASGSVKDFTESEAFKKFCGCYPKEKKIEDIQSAEEALGSLPAGSLEKMGETNYMEKMYKGLKRSFEYSGTKFTPTESGLEAPGIQLKRIHEPDEDALKEILVNIDGDVSFATGSAALTPKAKEIIAKIANAMVAYPETDVRIGGHTDSVGSFLGNLALSKRRAQSVKREIQNGRDIPDERFTEVDGYADKFKIVDTPYAEPKNRRTEIYLGPYKITIK